MITKIATIAFTVVLATGYAASAIAQTATATEARTDDAHDHDDDSGKWGLLGLLGVAGLLGLRRRQETAHDHRTAAGSSVNR